VIHLTEAGRTRASGGPQIGDREGYSILRTSRGSTLAARRAGMNAARRRQRFSSIRYARASRSRRASQPVSIINNSRKAEASIIGRSFTSRRPFDRRQATSAELWDTTGSKPSFHAVPVGVPRYAFVNAGVRPVFRGPYGTVLTHYAASLSTERAPHSALRALTGSMRLASRAGT
jgi:hypothetical protein